MIEQYLQKLNSYELLPILGVVYFLGIIPIIDELSDRVHYRNINKIPYDAILRKRE